ncbi:hypothetical protein, partial [Streptomyces omiyaensis]
MRTDRAVLTRAVGRIGPAVSREPYRLREESGDAFAARAVGRRPSSAPTGVGPLADAGPSGADEWAD